MPKRQREDDGERLPTKKTSKNKEPSAAATAVPLKAFTPRPNQPTTPALAAAEIDFPRGGGSSFTPLESKAIRVEAIQELKEEEQIFKVCVCISACLFARSDIYTYTLARMASSPASQKLSESRPLPSL